MSVQEFLNLESYADRLVEKLPLLSLPIRTVLTACYRIADVLFHGSPLNKEVKPRPLAGQALACRFSYLAPLLLRCPLEPTGAGAYDALSIMTLENCGQLATLLSYGHLCELVPEVRRGYYCASVSESKFAYALAHISDEFSRIESQDILLNDLVVPFVVHPPFDDELFERQVKFLPNVDTDVLASLVGMGTEWYREFSFECPIVSNQALLDSIGVSLLDFFSFRAAWLSIAQYCNRMGAAISRALVLESGAAKERLAEELMDWQTPYLEEKRLLDVIKQVTGLKTEQYDALMRIFCIDPEVGRTTAGDGFYPPLFRLGNSLLFQPDVLQVMLSSRNIPYAVNKIDRETFDTKLSPHLEPRLLQIAEEIIQKVPDLRIGTNLRWQHGEIDMFVLHPEGNVGLHIQAKGAMPPQGSRMVQAIETRVQEGIRQLMAFRLLPQEQKDTIISHSFNIPVVDIKIVDALLVWSSFGTKSIWEQFQDIATLNIPLLFMLVKENRFLPLDQMVVQTATIIQEIIGNASPYWHSEKIGIGEFEIEVPAFDYDTDSLFQYKQYLKEFA